MVFYEEVMKYYLLLYISLKSGMFYFTCSHKQKNTNIIDIREHASVVLEKQTKALSILSCYALPAS